jgi:hypothetical protein
LVPAADTSLGPVPELTSSLMEKQVSEADSAAAYQLVAVASLEMSF